MLLEWESIRSMPLQWETTNDPEYPYQTHVVGQHVVLRLNDFPEETLYTLLIDTVDIAHFDDWPEAWHR